MSDGEPSSIKRKSGCVAGVPVRKRKASFSGVAGVRILLYDRTLYPFLFLKEETECIRLYTENGVPARSTK